MIEIKNICKSFNTFSGTVNALKNVSLSISKGSCTVIGGENGSGKSLLVSILAGLEEADSGQILFSDDFFQDPCESGQPEENFPESTVIPQATKKNTKSKKFTKKQDFSKNPSSSVGLVFQEAETQILGETPAEDIAFGPKNLGFSKEKIEKAVQNALIKSGLEKKADFPARFLSGGEKRRLAIACMLAMEKPVIVLDEPYANLDYSGVKQVNQLVKELKSAGKTIIILTHEIEKCLALADRFVVLFRGEKVFDGSPEQALSESLEKWNIHNPLLAYKSLDDLVW